MARTKKNHTIVDTARQLGDDLYESGRKVWTAGLGAVALAEDKSRETFDHLVARGETFDGIDTGVVAEAKKIGRDVEDRVQETVGKTLSRAGVPSREELHLLIDRVELLTAKVDEIAKQRGAKA